MNTECGHSMELMRRLCAYTCRLREALIWESNDDPISILECSLVQLVTYITVFQAASVLKGEDSFGVDS